MPATGGSFPATIWHKFMEVAAANLTGEFVAVTPEQIRNGEVLNEGELLTPEETVPTTPPDDGNGNGNGAVAPTGRCPTSPCRRSPGCDDHHDPPSPTTTTSPTTATGHGPDDAAGPARRPGTTPSEPPDLGGEPPRDGAPAACSAVDGLVGVLAAAGEAPRLHLVDHLHRVGARARRRPGPTPRA